MLLIFKPAFFLVTWLGRSWAALDHSASLLRQRYWFENKPSGFKVKLLYLWCWAYGRGTNAVAAVAWRGVVLAQEGCKDKLLYTARSLANMLFQ